MCDCKEEACKGFTDHMQVSSSSDGWNAAATQRCLTLIIAAVADQRTADG